jgi:hypothetical protein
VDLIISYLVGKPCFKTRSFLLVLEVPAATLGVLETIALAVAGGVAGDPRAHPPRGLIGKKPNRINNMW